MGNWNVRHIEQDDLTWAFRSGGPTWTGPAGHAELDPCPAYQHGEHLVTETLAHVVEVAPTPWSGTVFICLHEETSRTNGWSSHSTRWDDEAEAWRVEEGVIFLGAKRIPPHPAVTRYVVAHEYGHQVNYMLAEQAGVEFGDFAREYGALRGMEPSDRNYGAGTWHASPIEVFACDFRLVVAGVETEYWPHPGVERPGRDVERWWSDHFTPARSAA